MGEKGDTQRRRLEFARWRAAYEAGKPALSANELTALAIRAGHKRVSPTYAGRVEVGERPVMLDWAQSIGRVARVDAGWLLMLDGAAEPEGYAEWLRKQHVAGDTDAGAGAVHTRGPTQKTRHGAPKKKRRAG